MKIWSLASGSSGNCYLVQDDETLVLLDAGISARRVCAEIARLGLDPSRLSALLVTHEHTDHWGSALALSRRMRIPLVATPGTLEAAGNGSKAEEFLPIIPGGSVTVGTISVGAFSIPHDARQPVGYLLRSRHASICAATDIGVVTDEILEHSRGADLVVLESNHDEAMVVRGPYPLRLKERILGRFGHLSNRAAGEAIAHIAGGRARQFWLAHLSGTNNSPGLALGSVRDVLRREGLAPSIVSVALRDRRSLFWDSEAASLEQLPLF
jgi:phosphoribosyl 1,2-cyclic phosphodiesterase